MEPISVTEFAKKLVKNNPDLKFHDVKNALDDTLAQKVAGAKCDNCLTMPIWAIGSAICGWNGCFTCLTGSADSSEEYEVIHDVIKSVKKHSKNKRRRTHTVRHQHP